MSEHHWISSAIKHHGVFRSAAKRAGMSTEAFARKHEHASGVLGHRARLALTLMHLNHHDERGGEKTDEMDEFKTDVADAMQRQGPRAAPAK